MRANLKYLIPLLLICGCKEKKIKPFFECRSEASITRNYQRFSFDNLLKIDSVQNKLLFSDSVSSFFCENRTSGADKMYFVFHFSNGESSRVYLFSNYTSYLPDTNSPYCVYEKVDSCYTPLINGTAQVKKTKLDGSLSEPISDSLRLLYLQFSREFKDKKYDQVK